MAYFERYYHVFCDRFGETHRISIMQKDFIGTAIELEGQPDPIIITYESSEGFKFSPIRPSSAEIFLTFGTGNMVDFEEFWTADEREFKIEYFKQGIIQWLGFVIPDGFEHEYKGGVYYAQIKANDGLSTLENIPFSLNGLPYGIQTPLTYNTGFMFPFILIATEILRKLDLDINTWTAVDVYEKNMQKTGDSRDADPLATSFVNVKTYITDSERRDIPYWKDVDEVMDCKEVMENLCHIWGAKIYQNKGVWRIKRINVDADYGTGLLQRYWRKYNTAAVYLGREIVDNEITIKCSTIENAMIGNDFLMSSDEVYAAFRINYEYTFVREGDEPVALIKNPLMKNFFVTSPLSTPEKWVRYRKGTKWYPKLKPYTMTAQDILDNNGTDTAIEMGTQASGFNTGNTDPNAAIWASLRYNEPINVINGEKLILSLSAKYRALRPDRQVGYYPVFKITLTTEDKVFFLRNESIILGDFILTKYTWTEDDVFFYWLSTKSENYDPNLVTTDRWYHFRAETDGVPDDGSIVFDIHGLAASSGRSSDNFPPFPAYTIENGAMKKTNFLRTVREGWVDQGGNIPRLKLTNVGLGRFPNESELPDTQDFVYKNPFGNYSLQVDPIKILNGDTQDENHISNILVPSNNSGLKNSWDTIDDKFGKSSLGLITTKSIMSQYFRPFRVLEGSIMAKNLDFDKRVVFEPLPNVRFIMQSASFNPRLAFVEDVVFKEISSEAIPAGGLEGGNTLEPRLEPTGESRCQKGGDGLNTGFIEAQFIDNNPSSESFQDTFWEISDTQDLQSCPLGRPFSYYWGTDDAVLEISKMKTFTFKIDILSPKSVEVRYSNPGGEFVYFIHLASLGLVQKVTTQTQDNIISDFQYLADIIIGGFTYKVLRQNFITADFNNVEIIYTFNQDQIEVPSNVGVQKNYYRLNNCGGTKKRYTTIQPLFSNQLYINTNESSFWTWDGPDFTLSITSPPKGFDASLQRITGETGCP